MARLIFCLSAAGLLLSSRTAWAQQTPSRSPLPPNASTPSAVERDLRVFSDWVNEKLDQAEARLERDKPRVKAEYDRQSTRLDRALDSLSVKSRREYDTQKSRYKDWQRAQDSLATQARRPETAQQTQARLLGETVVLSRARATELPDLYHRLLETTRQQRRQWTAADWSEASAVLERLNARYEQVHEQLPLEERLRVRSLQGEFRTLEKARNAKDILNEGR